MDDSKSGRESDIVSFWLLLLFIAAFVGIAAEHARQPAQASEIKASFDPRANAVEALDLLSRDRGTSVGPIGVRGEKFEVPATGK